MQRKLIRSDDLYDLFYDSSQAKIELISKNDQAVHLVANFKFDTSDGAALLSDFQYRKFGKNNLVRVTADLISDYLATQKNGCKLFCIPGPHESELSESKDYRSEQIDRLMLRETKTTATQAPSLSSEITIESLESKSVTLADRTQLIGLLKNHTYWGKDATDEYILNAIKNSKYFLVARDKDSNIIGLARAPSNNGFAYISDMVVRSDWRKKGIGTRLMHQLCQLIDKDHKLVALIRAKEGDGLEAGPKLYGQKFDFVEYNESHCTKIFFRYIKLRPELVQHHETTPQTIALQQKTPKFRNTPWSLGKMSVFAGAALLVTTVAARVISQTTYKR